MHKNKCECNGVWLKWPNRMRKWRYVPCLRENLQQNTKKFWEFLNKTLGRNIKGPIQLKDENSVLITDNVKKCDMLSKYFLEIPKTLNGKIIRFDGDCCNSLNTLKYCSYQFSFTTTNEEELQEIITSLHIKKSPDHDGIYSKLIIRCKELIISNLVNIFNGIVSDSE